MAFENNQVLETFTAAADLSAKRYHLVRLSAADNVNQASNPGGTDNLGVLQNKPESGEAATVIMGGMAKVVAGSSMAVGALFTTSASGRAVTAAPASGVAAYVYGQVLEAPTADGDIVSVWLTRPWRFVAIG